jgi:Ca2+-binding RTX toxin-like protein
VTQTLSTTPTVTGGPGNETLTGGTGADVISGGGGTDILRGGTGADVYLFSSTSGTLSVEEVSRLGSQEADIVQIDALPGDVQIARSGKNVVLSLGDATLTLTNFYQSATSGVVSGTSVEFLRFSDGTRIGVAEISELAWIRGTSGNDSLVGTSSHDTLHGGAGSDTLNGGDGDDTYVSLSGDGDDFVAEMATGNDVIHIADAVLADFVVTRWIDSSGDRITLTRLHHADAPGFHGVRQPSG